MAPLAKEPHSNTSAQTFNQTLHSGIDTLSVHSQSFSHWWYSLWLCWWKSVRSVRSWKDDSYTLSAALLLLSYARWFVYVQFGLLVVAGWAGWELQVRTFILNKQIRTAFETAELTLKSSFPLLSSWKQFLDRIKICIPHCHTVIL